MLERRRTRRRQWSRERRSDEWAVEAIPSFYLFNEQINPLDRSLNHIFPLPLKLSSPLETYSLPLRLSSPLETYSLPLRSPLPLILSSPLEITSPFDPPIPDWTAPVERKRLSSDSISSLPSLKQALLRPASIR